MHVINPLVICISNGQQHTIMSMLDGHLEHHLVGIFLAVNENSDVR